MAKTKNISVQAHDSFPLSKLSAYEHNAKLHTDEQIQHIANSIREFGFDQPVVCDEAGIIIAGHGRVLASAALGLTEIPVWQVTGLSADAKRALRLADNKLNLDTGFDVGALRLEMSKLADCGLDLASFSLAFDFDISKIEERSLDVDTTAEKKEAYDNASTKQVVLYFSHDEHQIFDRQFRQLATDWQCETYADVLLEMLRKEGAAL